MKFVRFVPLNTEANRKKDSAAYGILEPDQDGVTIRPVLGDPLSTYTLGSGFLKLGEVILKAPVLPSKIIAIGVNYPAHAREFKKSPPEEPLIFLKPPTAVIGPEEEIRYPSQAAQVDLEAELAVVMKREVKDITPQESKGAIWGYTCFNDVTARDLQRRDGQWTRAKGFDTFAPIGPWIVTDLDPTDLAIESRINGSPAQSARTSEMVFDVYTLVSFISRVMTLLPGDVIATGTPAGVSSVRRGDVVEISIEGIGSLRNKVV